MTWIGFAGGDATPDSGWAWADTPPRSPRQSRQTALMSHDLLRTPHPLWKILFLDVQSSFSSVRLFPLMTSTMYAFFGGGAERRATAPSWRHAGVCPPSPGRIRHEGRVPERRKETPFVDPSGHHQHVVGEIPHHELDDPVVAGKGEFLRLFREQGKGHRIHGDRLVLLLLDHLARGENPDVLKDDFGDLFLRVAGRGMS